MHAVVFHVDMKQGWKGDQDAELKYIVGMVKSVPGFVRGTWMSDGTTGVSCILFEAEEAARGMADGAALPPTASATLRSVEVYEVVREA